MQYHIDVLPWIKLILIGLLKLTKLNKKLSETETKKTAWGILFRQLWSIGAGLASDNLVGPGRE